LLFVRDLGRTAAELGLFLAAGGLGAFTGSMLARRLADRFGSGRTVCLGNVCTAPLAFALPFLDGGISLPLTGLAWFGMTVSAGVNNVLAVSFRQRATPEELLGRMNATFRFLLTGALAVGAAVAGVVGELADPRAVLWVGAAIFALAWVPVVCSPLRTTRDLPE